jgi:hypothetical protein
MNYIKHLLLLLFVVTLSSCSKPTLDQLDTPENLRFEDLLRWDEVEHATNYIVYINDVGYPVSDTYYVIAEQGDYSIYVVALAGNYEDSEHSDIFELTLFYENIIAPDISISGNTIEWDVVDDAVSYNVFLNGVKNEVTGTEFLLDTSGVYEVSVQAVYPVGKSNVSESVIIDYDLSTEPIQRYQYSLQSTGPLNLLNGDLYNTLYVKDADGNFLDSNDVLIKMGDAYSIKSSFITGNPVGVFECYVLNNDSIIPIEITIYDKDTPYIMSSSIIWTDGSEDIVLQFELFTGEVYSINGTVDDTVLWSAIDDTIIIDKDFINGKFQANSNEEFSLSYVINIGNDSVIGYLHFRYEA